MGEAVKGITFEQIEKVASDMIIQGVKPTVRGIMAVTGGKTEVVSKHLRDFFEKRDNEVPKMADELGGSNIAKLIASEMQIVADRHTTELQEINLRQKEQIDELIELLNERVHDAEQAKADAAAQIEKASRDAAEKVDAATAKAEKTVIAAKQAESDSEKALLKAEGMVQSAREKAEALVEAANKNASLAQQEAVSLREQVKALSIEAAKRELEQVELEEQKKATSQLRIDLAEQKTELVRMIAENKNFQKDIDRLESENSDNKKLAVELSKTQTLYVEAQRQLMDLQNKLSLSDRERDSLATALSRVQEKAKEASE
jgi:hypothetical protein